MATADSRSMLKRFIGLSYAALAEKPVSHDGVPSHDGHLMGVSFMRLEAN